MPIRYDTPEDVQKWGVVNGENRPYKDGDMVAIGDYWRLYYAMLEYKHAYEDATFGE